MRRVLIAMTAAAAVTACAKHDAPTAQPDAAALQEQKEQAEDEANFVAGWQDADGPGETAIVWRAGPNATQYTLSCVKDDTSFNAHVEAPGEIKGPTKGQLYLGSAMIEGTVTPDGDPSMPMVAFKTKLTPALLKTIAGANSSRLVVGDAFTDAGVDETGKAFQSLAQSCAAITGVKPAA